MESKSMKGREGGMIMSETPERTQRSRIMPNNRIILLFTLVSFGCSLLLSAELEGESYAREVLAIVKPQLNLPYDKEADYKSKKAELPGLNTLVGVGDFAVVANVDVFDSPTKGQEWLSIYVCSSDLSAFRLSISKPKSCSAACDTILERTVGRGEVYSNHAMIHKFNTPSLKDKTYSLITKHERYTRVFRLSIERGILLQVEFFSDQQPLRSPVNREVVVAQMKVLIDDLIALTDGDKKTTEEKEEYYKKLKAAYSEAMNRAAVKNTPGSAAKFDLFLSEVPTQEQTDEGLLLEMKKTEKVTAQRPYLIAQADGKAIPLVKIADPKKVHTKVTEQEVEKTVSDAISDIQFQVSVQGKPSYFEAALRSDGQYEVRFYGSGKRMLRVLYLDKRGDVVQFGEVEVEVVGEPRAASQEPVNANSPQKSTGNDENHEAQEVKEGDK
jgi:hypothetical protein